MVVNSDGWVNEPVVDRGWRRRPKAFCPPDKGKSDCSRGGKFGEKPMGEPSKTHMDVTRNLHNCPRCGQGHTNLDVRNLSSPIIDQHPADPSNPCTYHEWAICPNNGEPIMLQKPYLNDILIPVAPNRKQVEYLAYKLWELDGRKDDRDKVHWRLAEYALTRYFRIPSSTKMQEELGEQTMQDLLKASNEQIDKGTERMFMEYIEKSLEGEVKNADDVTQVFDPVNH